MLLDEQLVVFDRVKMTAEQGFRDKKKTVIVVKGGPGTGKSVIALNLLGDLSKKGLNTHYVTGSKAFTTTVRDIVGSRAAQQIRYFNSSFALDLFPPAQAKEGLNGYLPVLVVFEGAVPAEDDAVLPLEAEPAYRSGAESEEFAAARIEAEPGGGENAQEMGVGKERDMAADGEGPFDDGLGADGDLFDRLTVEDAVVPDGPARPLGANLGGSATVVTAVVPFGEVVVGLCDVAVSGDAAGLFGALARAGEHERERPAVEVVVDLLGAGFSVVGEGNVGPAGVLT